MNFLTNDTSQQREGETILQRVAAGDQEDVRECLEQYGGLVWCLAKKLIGRSAEMEDVVQEIFIAIWQNAGRFDPEKGKEATFIALIARRRLIDYLRRKMRKRETQLSDEHPVSCLADSERLIQIRLEAKRAKQVLNKLNPKQRKVLNMSIYGGFTHTEISEAMEIPLGTVKTLITRGFQKIRKSLGQETY